MSTRRRGRLATRIVLLWCAGISLRLTVLAVPPLLSQIHRQLRLSETEVGALTSLPVLLLALAAVPGSLLVARTGARRSLMVGLGIVGIFGALRPVGSSTALLFMATLLMGCGIAISQPCLPSVVKDWAPDLVGLGTAAFSNGLLIGEIVPVALTAPIIIPLLGGWQGPLAFWSFPVIATALAIVVLTEHQPLHSAVPVRWWPDWSDSRTWLLGMTLGGASASYWGANAFIPEFLRWRHEAYLITPALTALNLVQLPSSLAVALAPGRLICQRWPLAAAGATSIIAASALLVVPDGWVVAAAGLLGFSTALVFVLVLALPSLLARPGDAHRLSAAVFTISYTCPFVGSLIGGALWDVTGIAETAFVPLFAGGLLMVLMPRSLTLTAWDGSYEVLGST